MVFWTSFVEALLAVTSKLMLLPLIALEVLDSLIEGLSDITSWVAFASGVGLLLGISRPSAVTRSFDSIALLLLWLLAFACFFEDLNVMIWGFGGLRSATSNGSRTYIFFSQDTVGAIVAGRVNVEDNA